MINDSKMIILEVDSISTVIETSLTQVYHIDMDLSSREILMMVLGEGGRDEDNNKRHIQRSIFSP